MLLTLFFVTATVFVNALDNGLARTPPMGWMSWTAFYCEINCTAHPKGCINENLYEEMADRLVSDGYRDVGYVGIHVDDCWMERERDERGVLQADRQRFPSGMKNLAKYMHDRELKFGIYEDYGTKTCGGYPGSYGHLRTDAESFAQWDVDYLKLDGCFIGREKMSHGFPQMQRFLNKTGRPIVYSTVWPLQFLNDPLDIDYELVSSTCNVYRDFTDVNSSWASIASIIDFYTANQFRFSLSHGPGRWHDPDMLVIGNPGVTVDMARVQMTLWSIWSAPLIMSNDLRIIGNEFKAILLNKEVIAINQDPMGIMGKMVANTSDIGVYLKPIVPTVDIRSSFAIAVLNRNLTTAKTIKFQLSSIGLADKNGYKVRDLWTGRDLGRFGASDQLRVEVGPTSAVLYRAEIVDKYVKAKQLHRDVIRGNKKGLVEKLPHLLADYRPWQNIHAAVFGPHLQSEL